MRYEHIRFCINYILKHLIMTDTDLVHKHFGALMLPVFFFFTVLYWNIHVNCITANMYKPLWPSLTTHACGTKVKRWELFRRMKSMPLSCRRDYDAVLLLHRLASHGDGVQWQTRVPRGRHGHWRRRASVHLRGVHVESPLQRRGHERFCWHNWCHLRHYNLRG